MAEKVERAGVKREKGYVYFVDEEGDISRSKTGQKGRREKIKTLRVQREKGFLYFVDSEGDVSRSPMKRRS